MNENRKSYKVLAFKVNRDKQGGAQTISLHSHQDCMQQDVYFALMHNLLVSEFVKACLFNDFAV